MPSVEELEIQLAEARANSTQANVPTVPAAPADPYAVTTWGETEYDFKVPSGQTCRMRKLQPEEMIATGILDQMTKLPGIVQEQIDKAEGAPPVKVSVESVDTNQITSLLEVLNKLIPLVVAIPQVWPNPGEYETRVPGRVYVGDIELADRIAIMERATGGVNKFDNFREAA